MTRADGTSQTSGPDGERIFAALPPARGRAFTQTWWGARWLKALEDTALDGGQLRHGRRFAREGAVGAVSVRPGRITAVVRGRDGTPYRADVLLRELTGAEWDRLLEVTVRESGHIAALLDRHMPPRLVEDAESVGVELLPGIGDLEPTCDCDAWDHCPHTAALCYQMARLLDQDPFVLLLLRGRPERQLLDELGLRSASRSAETTATGDERVEEAEPAGVPADEAFALATVLPPLPAAPVPVAVPGPAPSLEGGSPPAAGLDAGALEFLVRDAAARAAQMLRDAVAPAHAESALPVPLTEGQDAVRLAAARPEHRIEERLAAGCGFTSAQLASAVCAWESGGAAALSVWDEPWTPGPEAMAR
ncbi:MAG TPA: SWF or SNF family helicase, partial [Streptomyces sp.]|nr:SWF or SNF family helicase [Streptomyces sp.]